MTTPEGWTWVYTCTDITCHLQVMMRSEKARPARLSNQCTSLNTRRHNTCENARSCRTRNMWKHLAVTNNAPRDIDQHVASAARALRTTQPESTRTSAHPLSQLKPSSSRNLPAPQSSPVTQTAIGIASANTCAAVLLIAKRRISRSTRAPHMLARGGSQPPALPKPLSGWCFTRCERS